MWLRAAVISVIMGLASNAAAQGVTQFGVFSVNPNDPSTIVLNGRIDENAALDFRRALSVFPQATNLLLNSPGGLVANGLLIADLAHERGFSTRIVRGAGCYSACAYIFFAGMPRQVDGELGVHQIAGADNIGDAQLAIANIIEMLQRFDTPPAVQAIMFRTRPDEIYVFTPQEIEALGINRTSASVPGVTPISVSAVTLTPATPGVNESVGAVLFTVTRSGALPSETLLISTSATEGFANNGDYVAISSRALVFSAGQAVQTFSVAITNDTLVESSERFGVQVARSGAIVARATFTIQDNDQPPSTQNTTYTLNPTAATVGEAAGTVVFTLTRSGTMSAATVFVSTSATEGFANDGDFVAISNRSLVFSAGQAVQTFSVAVTDDALVEGNERFAVQVARSGAIVARATFTIQDNEQTDRGTAANIDIAVEEYRRAAERGDESALGQLAVLCVNPRVVDRLAPGADNFLAVRRGPGTEYEIIYRGLVNGTVVYVCNPNSVSGWYMIRYGGGSFGWANAGYIGPSTSSSSAWHLLFAYQTTLSVRDHYNTNGVRLENVAAILQQDRYNFHVLGPGLNENDNADPLFDDPTYRATLPNLYSEGLNFARGDSAAVARSILNGIPVVVVRVYETTTFPVRRFLLVCETNNTTPCLQ